MSLGQRYQEEKQKLLLASDKNRVVTPTVNGFTVGTVSDEGP